MAPPDEEATRADDTNGRDKMKKGKGREMRGMDVVDVDKHQVNHNTPMRQVSGNSNLKPITWIDPRSQVNSAHNSVQKRHCYPLSSSCSPLMNPKSFTALAISAQ